VSAELASILGGIPEGFAGAELDAAATRRLMAPLHGHPVAPDTTVAHVNVGGVPCAWVSRPEVRPERGAVFFVHGGAFVSCTVDDYLFYAEFIALACELPVFVVGYRLAPETRFPGAYLDCQAALGGLLAEGQDPARLVVFGDSCGGGIALGAVMGSIEAGSPGPAAVVSLSGWVDLDTSGYDPAFAGRRDPFISEAFLRARASDYLGRDGDTHDPRASPARGSLTGLAALLCQVGEVDLCRLDAERLAARAPAIVTLDVIDGGVHGVQGLVGLEVPEAVEAWAHVARFVDASLPR